MDPDNTVGGVDPDGSVSADDIGEMVVTCRCNGVEAEIVIETYDIEETDVSIPDDYSVKDRIETKVGEYSDVEFEFDVDGVIPFEYFGNIYFSSVDKDIAEVNQKGEVYAKNTGETTVITAWINNNKIYVKSTKLIVKGDEPVVNPTQPPVEPTETPAPEPTKDPGTDIPDNPTVTPTEKPVTDDPTGNTQTSATPAPKTQPQTDQGVNPSAASESKAPAVSAVSKAVKKKKADKKIKLKIKKTSGANGYQIAIYKSKKNASKSKKAIVTKYSKKTKITIRSKRIKNRKKLFVRVRAYKESGNTLTFGKWSVIKVVH